MRKLPTLDMSRDTYYIVLGVPETATQDEIKRAYRRLIKQIHPDKFSNASPNRRLATETRSREVIEAYYVLSDSAQRSSYDQQLVRYRQQHTPSLPQPRTASTPPSRAARENPRSWPRADQKGANWEFLRRVLQFGLNCVSFLIVAVIFVSLFIDILMSLFELLQPS
jgi:curved DNA-binding protein CbpA